MKKKKKLKSQWQKKLEQTKKDKNNKFGSFVRFIVRMNTFNLLLSVRKKKNIVSPVFSSHLLFISRSYKVPQLKLSGNIKSREVVVWILNRKQSQLLCLLKPGFKPRTPFPQVPPLTPPKFTRYIATDIAEVPGPSRYVYFSISTFYNLNISFERHKIFTPTRPQFLCL